MKVLGIIFLIIIFLTALGIGYGYYYIKTHPNGSINYHKQLPGVTLQFGNITPSPTPAVP